MPLFRDYSENGKLVDQREESLTVVNLPRYVREHGCERADAYQLGIRHGMHELEQALKNCDHNSDGTITAHTARRELLFANSMQADTHVCLFRFTQSEAMLPEDRKSEQDEIFATVKKNYNSEIGHYTDNQTAGYRDALCDMGRDLAHICYSDNRTAYNSAAVVRDRIHAFQEEKYGLLEQFAHIVEQTLASQYVLVNRK